jgi:hypothetical protein
LVNLKRPSGAFPIRHSTGRTVLVSLEGFYAPRREHFGPRLRFTAIL